MKSDMTSKAVMTAILALASFACIGLALAPRPAAAAFDGPDPARNDLRDLKVGMSVAELPSKGYVELFCAKNPDQKLTSWSEYTRCSPDEQGRYDIRFKFDESTNILSPLDDKYSGTKVGGHPVILTLMIGSAARVTGLDIKTDPKARLSLRKRAFLLATQAMNFYGSDGWKCEGRHPDGEEAPIGNVFIDQRCEKVLPQRKVIVERRFFRPADADIRNMVSTSEITVLNGN